MGFKRRGGFKARTSWQEIRKENEQWESYYKALGLPAAEEFAEFKATLQRDLPLTFRITGSNKNAQEVREMMETRYIGSMNGVEFEGEPLQPPAPLAFYPDKLGWQASVGKQVIRKNPEFAKLQRFLVVETAVGNISRQEAVSMIPPLFMDVQPHHAVLDTCASPGSKTAQLIEALHRNGARPTGVVIANDADYKRSHMLTHQIKRLNSPNVLVTNHDAQLFPKIRIGDNEYLKFDRILCDVPCSGDGTMRKNINVWKEWSVGNGLGLHQLQVNIAARGLQMLKPGGRLVYSTCSLNPVENEAVVAQLLRQFPNVHIVDVSEQYPDLKRAPGISEWKVQAKDKTWQDPATSTLARSLFAPQPEEAERFNLDRTLRVYPHQQNTGGFYIAVLEKDEAAEPAAKRHKPAPEAAAAAAEPAEQAIEAAAEASVEATPAPDTAVSSAPAGDGAAADPDASKRLPRDAVEEPFHFLSPDHETVRGLWDFYQIKDFPNDTLVVRNQTGEPVRTIYYVAPAIRPILELNEHKLKFIHTGIKLFAQQKNAGECKWRVQSEGIALLSPSVGPARIVETENLEALKFLCQNEFPRFYELEETDKALHDQVVARSEGCCLLRIGDSVFPLWRGRASVNIMLAKEAVEEILLRVFSVSETKSRHGQGTPNPRYPEGAPGKGNPANAAAEAAEAAQAADVVANGDAASDEKPAEATAEPAAEAVEPAPEAAPAAETTA